MTRCLPVVELVSRAGSFSKVSGPPAGYVAHVNEGHRAGGYPLKDPTARITTCLNRM